MDVTTFVDQAGCSVVLEAIRKWRIGANRHQDYGVSSMKPETRLTSKARLLTLARLKVFDDLVWHVSALSMQS